MDEKIKNLLQVARHELKAEPSPYLKYRVLNQCRELKRRSRWLKAWQWSTATTLAMGLLGWALLLKSPSASFQAALHRPQLVRMEVTDLAKEQLARAQIELPHGVYFYSEEFPDLEKQRRISFEWSVGEEAEHLPFVVTAKETGVKTIKVKFFDHGNKLIGTKELAIDFVGLGQDRKASDIGVGT